MKLEITDIAVYTTEDGGAALIYEIAQSKDGPEDCIFVKIQSWDETKKHEIARQLQGKKVKVTIETIE